MDGNFHKDDAETSATKVMSTTSDAMELAEKSLGGRKRWRGEVNGLLGLLRRGFEIQSIGKLESRGLVFNENLEFDDGEIQERSWLISQATDGLVIEADGVEILKPGQVKNQELVFVYRLKLGKLTFRYQDSFYLRTDGQVTNEGKASWYGLPVMKIIATGRAVT